jgi:hypothetical protein
MLFQIKCDRGHVGLVSSLPRRAFCSECRTSKYFKVKDGARLLPPKVEPDTPAEVAAERLEADTVDWVRAYQGTVRPRSDPAGW